MGVLSLESRLDVSSCLFSFWVGVPTGMADSSLEIDDFERFLLWDLEFFFFLCLAKGSAGAKRMLLSISKVSASLGSSPRMPPPSGPNPSLGWPL